MHLRQVFPNHSPQQIEAAVRAEADTAAAAAALMDVAPAFEEGADLDRLSMLEAERESLFNEVGAFAANQGQHGRLARRVHLCAGGRGREEVC